MIPTPFQNLIPGQAPGAPDILSIVLGHPAYSQPRLYTVITSSDASMS